MSQPLAICSSRIASADSTRRSTADDLDQYEVHRRGHRFHRLRDGSVERADGSIAASYQRRRTAWGFNGGGPGSALWKTVDGAKTWKTLEAAACRAYGNWGRVGLAFARSNPKIVYAMIEPVRRPSAAAAARPARAAATALDPNRAGIWRSEDKGATWKLVRTRTAARCTFSQIRVDPKDANTVFALERSLYKSTDGAKTFLSIPEGVLARLPEPAQTPSSLVAPFDRDPGIERSAAEPSRSIMRCGSIRQTRSTSSSGTTAASILLRRRRTWQLQNAMPLGQFYHVAVDMRQPYWIYGGAQDNGVWGGPSRVRNNGGITREHWSSSPPATAFTSAPIRPTPNIVYMSVSGNGGQFLWRKNFRSGEQRFDPADAAAPRRRSRNQTALPATGNIVTPLPAGEAARLTGTPGSRSRRTIRERSTLGAQRLSSRTTAATRGSRRRISRRRRSRHAEIMDVAGSQPMTAKNNGVAAYSTIVAVAE